MLLEELIKNRKDNCLIIRMIVNVGDFYGGIFICYASNINYEKSIELILLNKESMKESITFFAEMKFNSSYTEVESHYGYFDEIFKKKIKFYGTNPFFEVSEKLRGYSPITPGVFIELVKNTLNDVYNISSEFKVYEIPFKELETYYLTQESAEILGSNPFTVNHFYVGDSVFNCCVNKSEELILEDYNFPEFPIVLLNFHWLKKLELFNLLISEIPEQITNLRNLTSLSLNSIFIDELPTTLSRLTNLEILKLEHTQMIMLPNSLFELVKLKELQVINNKGIRELPDEISKLKSLEYLYAFSNNIETIPKTIFGLENLKLLNLSYNRIRNLPSELTSLPNLGVLELSDNQLQQIPNDLFEMESLQEVDLSKNPDLDPSVIYDLLMKSCRSDKINLIL